MSTASTTSTGRRPTRRGRGNDLRSQRRRLDRRADGGGHVIKLAVTSRPDGTLHPETLT